MARSEYIGHQCPFCQKVWESADFERINILEADYFDPKENIMYIGTYWDIRCKVCGKVGRFLESARPKTKGEK